MVRKASVLIPQAGGEWQSCYRKAQWTEKEVTAAAVAIYRQRPSAAHAAQNAPAGGKQACFCFNY